MRETFTNSRVWRGGSTGTFRMDSIRRLCKKED